MLINLRVCEKYKCILNFNQEISFFIYLFLTSFQTNVGTDGTLCPQCGLMEIRQRSSSLVSSKCLFIVSDFTTKCFGSVG